MSEISSDLPALQEPLDKILRAEIDSGNEIAEIQIGGWSLVDIVVTLKFPFRRNYADEFSNITFYRNTDTHYALTDSYSANREAVEAPY